MPQNQEMYDFGMKFGAKKWAKRFNRHPMSWYKFKSRFQTTKTKSVNGADLPTLSAGLKDLAEAAANLEAAKRRMNDEKSRFMELFNRI